MRKAVFGFFIMTLVGCQEELKPPVVVDAFDPSLAILAKEGMFVGTGGHEVIGRVKIYDDQGTWVVVLDPFFSTNGPDLKVYLSLDENASQYIRLGALKSPTGNQIYRVPNNPDIAPYTYVHIWCEQFSVEFGKAEVQ